MEEKNNMMRTCAIDSVDSINQYILSLNKETECCLFYLEQDGYDKVSTEMWDEIATCLFEIEKITILIIKCDIQKSLHTYINAFDFCFSTKENSALKKEINGIISEKNITQEVSEYLYACLRNKKRTQICEIMKLFRQYRKCEFENRGICENIEMEAFCRLVLEQ